MIYIDKNSFSKSGVYCIVNTANQKKYIGSSKNCYLRAMDHRAELRSNVHCNKHLQNSFNKYGEDNFVIIFLEACDENKRIEREKFYMDLLSPEYNLIVDPVEVVFSDDTRKRMSESRKLGFERGTVVAYQKIPIHKYDLEGNYICSYDSLKEACELNNMHQCTINRYFKNGYSQCNGALWSKEKVAKMPPYRKKKRNNDYFNKAVILEDIVNCRKLEFPSIKSCAEYLNVTHSSIYQVIKNKNIYKKQYKIYLKTGV